MQMHTIISLFTLFSGIAEVEPVLPLLQAAQDEVTHMLRPGADQTDVRLCYLTAAIANLRHSQMLAAQEHVAYTYAGTAVQETDGSRCSLAQALADAYLKAASDLIVDNAFCFLHAGV